AERRNLDAALTRTEGRTPTQRPAQKPEPQNALWHKPACLMPGVGLQMYLRGSLSFPCRQASTPIDGEVPCNIVHTPPQLPLLDRFFTGFPCVKPSHAYACPILSVLVAFALVHDNGPRTIED